jgi:hypothetical protein
MQYVLVFEQAFRMGLEIIEVVGPFDSIDAARLWHSSTSTWKIEPPPCTVRAMFSPQHI